MQPSTRSSIYAYTHIYICLCLWLQFAARTCVAWVKWKAALNTAAVQLKCTSLMITVSQSASQPVIQPAIQAVSVATCCLACIQLLWKCVGIAMLLMQIARLPPLTAATTASSSQLVSQPLVTPTTIINNISTTSHTDIPLTVANIASRS